MTTAKTKLLTADDLLRLYSEGVRGELIRGVLCETVPVGNMHGEIVMNVGVAVGSFIRPRRLGRIIGSDAGIRLGRDPDTVREPDLAFTSAERMPFDVRPTSFSEVVPDLVMEVASPSDSIAAVNDKALMWLAYGVTLVWVVYPESRTIEVHQTGVPVVTLTEDDTLDGAPVLPGFTLPLRDVFELE